MKRSTVSCVLACVVLIPMTLFLGTQLKGRWYYLTSTLVLLEAMAPFFLSFETRKPQARELVLIAVLCALAVASRVAVLVPNFKPMMAIVMIAGIAMGGEAGFMVGAVSALASNFFYSQGPWTPWQMMACGFGGFLAGQLFHTRKKLRSPVLLAVFSFLAVMLVVGPLLDCCTLFTTGGRLSWKFALAVFTVGLPMNLSQAAACSATMLLFSKPLLAKLERVIQKYGMMDNG